MLHGPTEQAKRYHVYFCTSLLCFVVSLFVSHHHNHTSVSPLSHSLNERETSAKCVEKLQRFIIVLHRSHFCAYPCAVAVV